MRVAHQRAALSRTDRSERLLDLAEGNLRTIDCAGFTIHLGKREDYFSLVTRCIRSRRKTKILNHNLHSLFHYQTNERLRKIFDRSIVMVDGTSILAILRAHGHEVQFEHRMAWIDFVWPLLTYARDHHYRVYWLGNTQATNDRALAILRDRLPGLKIAGHDGFFDLSPRSPDSLRVVLDINRFDPDILILGMGTPVQEYWIEDHHPMLNVPVAFSAGACLEFISGYARTPPRWLGPLGLEWSYRLISDPGRFAYRYLVEPWRVAYEIAKHDLNALVTRRVTLGRDSG